MEIACAPNLLLLPETSRLNLFTRLGKLSGAGERAVQKEAATKNRHTILVASGVKYSLPLSNSAGIFPVPVVFSFSFFYETSTRGRNARPIPEDCY